MALQRPTFSGMALTETVRTIPDVGYFYNPMLNTRTRLVISAGQANVVRGA